MKKIIIMILAVTLILTNMSGAFAALNDDGNDTVTLYTGGDLVEENEDSQSEADGTKANEVEVPVTFAGTYVYWNINPLVYACFSGWTLHLTVFNDDWSVFSFYSDINSFSGARDVGYIIIEAVAVPWLM